MSRPQRAPRADNRLPRLLDEAARLFGAQGFHGTSIRDIVGAVDMLPGLALLPLRAPRRTCSPPSMPRACAGSPSACRRRSTATPTPGQRLEAACVAHLEALLEENGYAQVVIRVRPSDVPSVAAHSIELRDEYEQLFVELIDALPLAPRRRPAQPAPDAARRAQLVADVVPAGPRRSARDRPEFRRPAAHAQGPE